MKGVVASPHAEATRTAMRAFELGGNAVDAALAAAAVLTVVYPHQTSVGGDLWALVAEPGGAVHAVNGSGAAPAAIDVEALRARFDEIPDSGPVPITVPGALAGWETVAGLGGRLGLAAAIAPAADLAREGTPISHSLAVAIRRRLELLAADPGLRNLFTSDGKPLAEGAIVRQPALAASLERIAADGTTAFYGGPVGAAFASGLRRLGSPLTLADLAEHETLLAEPIELAQDGYRFLTAPPNSQGFVLLEMLAALGGGGKPEPAAAVEAALLGIADREAWLGDPGRIRPPLERLLDPAQARTRLHRRGGVAPAPVEAGRGDTVAVVALDAEGRAVSLIQSVFQTFGASVLEPETGIICQNRGRGFSLRRGAPNELAPRTRPAHTLVPLLVYSGDAVVASIGTMGGRAQPQILLQILRGGALAADRALEQTLAAPRWVTGARDIDFDVQTIALEAHADRSFEEALATTGLPVARIPQYDERVGHSQIARVGAAGLEAATDPRSDGEAGAA